MNGEPVHHPILRPIVESEGVRAAVRGTEADVVVTDRRLAVASDTNLLLNVTLDNLRRLQFDVERGRPATLAVVPDLPGDPPQVLAVPAEELDQVADLLVHIGRHLAQDSSQPQ